MKTLSTATTERPARMSMQPTQSASCSAVGLSILPLGGFGADGAVMDDGLISRPYVWAADIEAAAAGKAITPNNVIKPETVWNKEHTRTCFTKEGDSGFEGRWPN